MATNDYHNFSSLKIPLPVDSKNVEIITPYDNTRIKGSKFYSFVGRDGAIPYYTVLPRLDYNNATLSGGAELTNQGISYNDPFCIEIEDGNEYTEMATWTLRVGHDLPKGRYSLALKWDSNILHDHFVNITVVYQTLGETVLYQKLEFDSAIHPYSIETEEFSLLHDSNVTIIIVSTGDPDQAGYELLIDYLDFIPKYTPKIAFDVDYENNSGECKVYDTVTTDNFDQTTWKQIHSAEHDFTGSIVIENNLVRWIVNPKKPWGETGHFQYSMIESEDNGLGDCDYYLAKFYPYPFADSYPKIEFEEINQSNIRAFFVLDNLDPEFSACSDYSKIYTEMIITPIGFYLNNNKIGNFGYGFCLEDINGVAQTYLTFGEGTTFTYKLDNELVSSNLSYYNGVQGLMTAENVCFGWVKGDKPTGGGRLEIDTELTQLFEKISADVNEYEDYLCLFAIKYNNEVDEATPTNELTDSFDTFDTTKWLQYRGNINNWSALSNILNIDSSSLYEEVIVRASPISPVEPSYIDGEYFAMVFNSTDDGANEVIVMDVADWSLVNGDTTFYPAGTVTGATFSPDGHYLIVTQSKQYAPTEPSIIIYDTTDWSYTYPAETPYTANKPKFSHDGSMLAVGTYDEPYVYVYDTSTWTVISGAPSFNLAGHLYALDWSPDDSVLACGHINSPYLTLIETTTWTKMDDPDTLPPYELYDVEFSHDGSMLAVANYDSPVINIYLTSNWTKIANPSSLPPGSAARGVSWNADDSILAVVSYSSPYLTRYNTSDWSKIDDPSSLPAWPDELSFNGDGSILACMDGSENGVTAYTTTDWNTISIPNYTNTESSVSGEECCFASGNNPASSRFVTTCDIKINTIAEKIIDTGLIVCFDENNGYYYAIIEIDETGQGYLKLYKRVFGDYDSSSDYGEGEYGNIPYGGALNGSVDYLLKSKKYNFVPDRWYNMRIVWGCESENDTQLDIMIDNSTIVCYMDLDNPIFTGVCGIMAQTNVNDGLDCSYKNFMIDSYSINNQLDTLKQSILDYAYLATAKPTTKRIIVNR